MGHYDEQYERKAECDRLTRQIQDPMFVFAEEIRKQLAGIREDIEAIKEQLDKRGIRK